MPSPAETPRAWRFDADLLRRYDRPGPRYTSYPTAPQFSEGFGEADFRAIAAAPTPSAHAFLDAWAYLCANPGLAPGRTDHSRLTWTREMLDGLYAEINLSRSLHGALTRDPGTRKEKTI